VLTPRQRRHPFPRTHPWRGADRDELDGHTRWTARLGGFLCRSGLHRLYDWSTGTRSLGMAARNRREVDDLSCRTPKATLAMI